MYYCSICYFQKLNGYKIYQTHLIQVHYFEQILKENCKFLTVSILIYNLKNYHHSNQQENSLNLYIIMNETSSVRKYSSIVY